MSCRGGRGGRRRFVGADDVSLISWSGASRDREIAKKCRFKFRVVDLLVDSPGSFESDTLRFSLVCQSRSATPPDIPPKQKARCLSSISVRTPNLEYSQDHDESSSCTDSHRAATLSRGVPATSALLRAVPTATLAARAVRPTQTIATSASLVAKRSYASIPPVPATDAAPKVQPGTVGPKVRPERVRYGKHYD